MPFHVDGPDLIDLWTKREHMKDADRDSEDEDDNK